MDMDPLLSPIRIVGGIWGKPNLPYKFLSHEASRSTSVRATYSDSVEDNVMIVCFFNFQVIALPEVRKTYPDVDFPSY
jgi:hypothetical protein